jgi:hypothetical protein
VHVELGRAIAGNLPVEVHTLVIDRHARIHSTACPLIMPSACRRPD